MKLKISVTTFAFLVNIMFSTVSSAEVISLFLYLCSKDTVRYCNIYKKKPYAKEKIPEVLQDHPTAI